MFDEINWNSTKVKSIIIILNVLIGCAFLVFVMPSPVFETNDWNDNTEAGSVDTGEYEYSQRYEYYNERYDSGKETEKDSVYFEDEKLDPLPGREETTYSIDVVNPEENLNLEIRTDRRVVHFHDDGMERRIELGGLVEGETVKVVYDDGQTEYLVDSYTIKGESKKVR